MSPSARVAFAAAGVFTLTRSSHESFRIFHGKSGKRGRDRSVFILRPRCCREYSRLGGQDLSVLSTGVYLPTRKPPLKPCYSPEKERDTTCKSDHERNGENSFRG